MLISSLDNNLFFVLRVELLVTTLETLLALSTFKEVALAFCQKVTINANESPPGIG